MDGGYPYPKSEADKTMSSASGSESDELSSDVVDKNISHTIKAERKIDRRMIYFKKHIKLLSYDQGKIVDPFQQRLLHPSDKVITHLASQATSLMSSVRLLSEKNEPSILNRSIKTAGSKTVCSEVSEPVGRSSSGEYQPTMDQLWRMNENEELNKNMKRFHNIRMKRLIATDKLAEYLEMLENKGQQRLIEEHQSSFRRFKYAGPAREGPLFCLREKYRRERKAWRVKYAKQYGLLCRKVRLEKKLMNKARRLLLKDRVLSAFKEKTKSKLTILLEMKKEFKKLIERLKLNKEIQDKIKRQGGGNKNIHQIGKRSPKTKKIKHKVNFAPDIPTTETVNLLKSPLHLDNKQHVSNCSVEQVTLSPLPSVPSTSMLPDTKTLPTIKKTLSQKGTSKKAPLSSNKSATSGVNLRFPPLVQDKKLGTAKFVAESTLTPMPLSSCSSVKKHILTGSKAKEAKSLSRVTPLIHDMKYRSAPFDDFYEDEFCEYGSNKRKSENVPNANARISPKSPFYTFDRVAPKEMGRSDPSNTCNLPEANVDSSESTKMPPWIPVRFKKHLAPKGFERQCDHNFPSRYKYKKKDCRQNIEKYAGIYKKHLNQKFKQLLGPCTDAILNEYVKDIKQMADFILDHLYMVPIEEVHNILEQLVKLKDEGAFKTLKSTEKKYSFTTDRNNQFRQRVLLKSMNADLKKLLTSGYQKFEEHQRKSGKDHKVAKSNKTRSKLKNVTNEPSTPVKKRKHKTLADKLLIQRGPAFHNPVRVTNKLGGIFMLQGWKPVTYDEYMSLGSKLTVLKSGWRKDYMENYQVIAPVVPKNNLKYLLIVNRLDLTPRRFKLPEYSYNSQIFAMMTYCSNFYRNNLLKREDIRLLGKGRTNHPRVSKFYVETALEEKEYRVPHLPHRIFNIPEHLTYKVKPSDKNTPLMFSKCSELPEFDEDDPKRMRVRLWETATLDLWSFESRVGVRGTDEAYAYAKDLRRVNKYTKRFHRDFERETQTELQNFIDRSTQAYAPSRDSKKTNVYVTDIVKATKIPRPPKTKPNRTPGFQEKESEDSTSEVGSSVSSVESIPDKTKRILTSYEFASKLKLTFRILDSQLYSEKQLTFRKGLLLDPLDVKAEIAYSHERLVSFIDKRIALSEYVVSSLDWSVLNPNLLAVGYSRHPLYPEQDKGMVCIWNVKLITKYEKKFIFKSGVTYLKFCVPFPRLLNVALLDGSVLIMDLGSKSNSIITTKLSSVFSDYKPVWQFSWYEIEKGNYIPLTCGDNGYIHQLRPDGTFQHSKFLSLGHKEGKVKGIKQTSSMGIKSRIRERPGITCLEKHPADPVLYLVGTTDGCVHICSIHFRNQHLDVFLAHVGAVKGIQFHPHCEHVFLTYGEDFYVRVWLYGTFEPALELMAGHYYVRAAKWSPSNPEILVSISNLYVDVWDIRRKTDTPIHRFKNPRQLENTALIFDSTGHNIALGNIGGDVYIYALKNMPFTYYFKGEAIASALEKVLQAKKKFIRDIRKLGYPFGTKNEM